MLRLKRKFLKVLLGVLALLLVVSPVSAGAEYTVTDLGDLGLTFPVGATAINNFGQIVGYVGGYNTDGISFRQHAFLYQNGVMADLGILGNPASVPNYPISRANDINDSGQIVGDSGIFDGDINLGHHGFLYEDGQMKDLLTLSGYNINPLAINESGQIVGDFPTSDPEIRHAVLYDHGTVTDLGSLGGSSTASSINDIGQIVGDYKDTDGNFHFFLYENGEMHDLDEFGSTRFPFWIDINNSGQILLNYDNLSGQDNYVIYKYPRGEIIDLGENTVRASAINDFGQVAGCIHNGTGGYTPAFWQNGQWTGLPSLEYYPPNYCGEDINDRGQMVGQNSHHPILWTVDVPQVTPDGQIQIINTEVANFVQAGILNGGQGEALGAKLDAAALQLNKDNTGAAVNLLQAFINQAEAMVKAGKITTAQGNVLINAANATINQLEN